MTTKDTDTAKTKTPRTKPTEAEIAARKLSAEYYTLKSRLLELESRLDDIEEKNRELEIENNYLVNFFQNSPVGYVCVNPEGVIINFNEKFAKMLGYLKKDMLNTTFKGYIVEEDFEKYNYFKSKIINSDTTHISDVRLIKANKMLLNTRLDGIFVKGDTGHIHIAVSDNTHIIIYEQSIRENEKKFRSMIEGLNDAIFRMSLPEGKLEYLSKSASEVFGYPLEKFFSSAPFIRKIIHPELKDHFTETWNNLVNGNVSRNYEYQIIDNEGNVRWIMQSNTPVFDSKNRIVALEGVCRNVTDVKLAQETVKQSEERFWAIANYTYDWENWSAPNGQLIWVNPSVERITGFSVEECMQMDDFPIPIINDEYRESARNELRNALAKQTSVHEIPFKIIRKDGEERWITASWQPIYSKDADYLGIRSSMRDITKRMQNQETMKKLIEELRFSNETIKKNMFEMTELKQKFEAVRNKYTEYKSDTDRFLGTMSAELINTFLGFNTILKSITAHVNEDNNEELDRISKDVMKKSLHSINMIEEFIKNQRR